MFFPKKIKFLLYSFAISLSVPAFSWDQEDLLLQILSQPENDLLHELFIRTDADNHIVEVYRISEKGTQVIDIQDMILGEVVLAKTSGIDALVVSCSGCSRITGGVLKLRYVSNGLKKNYRNFSMRIQQIEEEWILLGEDDSKIDNLTLVERKVLGQVVGIKKILINDF